MCARAEVCSTMLFKSIPFCDAGFEVINVVVGAGIFCHPGYMSIESRLCRERIVTVPSTIMVI